MLASIYPLGVCQFLIDQPPVWNLKTNGAKDEACTRKRIAFEQTFDESIIDLLHVSDFVHIFFNLMKNETIFLIFISEYA